MTTLSRLRRDPVALVLRAGASTAMGGIVMPASVWGLSRGRGRPVPAGRTASAPPGRVLAWVIHEVARELVSRSASPARDTWARRAGTGLLPTPVAADKGGRQAAALRSTVHACMARDKPACSRCWRGVAPVNNPVYGVGRSISGPGRARTAVVICHGQLWKLPCAPMRTSPA